MKPRDITIIHLSDLHFDIGRDMTYVDALLADIKQQIRQVKDLIIVVTGDLSTQSRVKQTTPDIIHFFRDLKSLISKEGCNLLDVEIVPGNHDLERPLCENDFQKGTFSNDLRAFDELAKKIYRVLGVDGRGRSGVSFVEYNDLEIAFVRVDTSGVAPDIELSAQIDSDFKEWRKSKKKLPEYSRKQVLDKRKAWVSEQIKEQGRAIKTAFYEHGRTSARRVLFTIAIAHHPLTWLNESGIDQIHDILFKKGLQYTDLWLCGHLHTSQLYYTNENSHQKVMLMSGIGRQDSPETCMRYSIYTLSFERNVCCVQSRGAREGLGFDEDFSMGRSASKGVRHLTIPLRSPQIGSVIRLNGAGLNRCKKDCYVDDDVLEMMREMAERISWFRANIGAKIRDYQHLLLDDLWENRRGKVRSDLAKSYFDYFLDGEDFELTAEQRELILSIVRSNQYVRFFAVDVCNELYQCLSRPIKEIDGLPVSPVFKDVLKWSDITWRLHFRIYRGCQKRKHEAAMDFYDCYASNEQADSIKPVPWSRSLIEQASKLVSKALIQSANQCENPIQTDWDDFLTAVPVFSNSEIRLRLPTATYESRPLLSFGLSVKCCSQEGLVVASRVLYALEFYGIDKIMGGILDDFLNAMKIENIRRCV